MDHFVHFSHGMCCVETVATARHSSVSHSLQLQVQRERRNREQGRGKRRAAKKFMPHPNGLLGNYTSELREGEKQVQFIPLTARIEATTDTYTRLTDVT